MIRHIAQHFLAESVIFRLKYMAETGINTIFIIKKAAEIVQPLRVSASKILLRVHICQVWHISERLLSDHLQPGIMPDPPGPHRSGFLA